MAKYKVYDVFGKYWKTLKLTPKEAREYRRAYPKMKFKLKRLM